MCGAYARNSGSAPWALLVVVVACQRYTGDAAVLRRQERHASLTNRILTNATATAYSEAGDGSHYVELLRFVTPYGNSLETVVDITAFSPFLYANTGAELPFYGFIDTWVGNNSGQDFIYLSNETGTCARVHTDSGNGWRLQVDLIFWTKEEEEQGAAADAAAVAQHSLQPRASITLKSDGQSSQVDIGRISTREGLLARNGNLLMKDEAGLDVMGNGAVYGCTGGAADLEVGRLLGYLEHREELAARYNRNQNEVDELAQDVYEHLAYTQMALLEVQGSGAAEGEWEASYDSEEVSLQEGMPVYFAGGVFTEARLYANKRINMSYPFKPVGRVLSVRNRTGTVTLEMNMSCAPKHIISNSSSSSSSGSSSSSDNSSTELQDTAGPKLIVPISPRILGFVSELVEEARQRGRAAAKSEVTSGFFATTRQGPAGPRILVVQNKTLATRQPLGRMESSVFVAASGDMSLASSRPASALLQNGTNETQHVCVVTPSESGRFFEREYESPKMVPGEAALLHLTVTGHGWSSTTEQCGEYCHAVYVLRLNGQSVGNITQWRNDCHLNPNGVGQHGTWEESRNGWCPGSVEPGIYIDVTPFVNAGGTSRVSLDLVVWSNVTASYQPYVDYGGFATGDTASLSVRLNLFVYEADVVRAVRGQQYAALTAVERAIRGGCSHPSALTPPERPTSYQPPALLATRAMRGHRVFGTEGGSAALFGQQAQPEMPVGGERALPRLVQPPASRFNFEQRAPWYLYNQSSEGALGFGSHGSVRVVPVFQGSLVQAGSREVSAKLPPDSIPKDWNQVAVHFQLLKPPGNLTLDMWDRLGSFGMRFQESSSVHLK